MTPGLSANYLFDRALAKAELLGNACCGETCCTELSDLSNEIIGEAGVRVIFALGHVLVPTTQCGPLDNSLRHAEVLSNGANGPSYLSQSERLGDGVVSYAGWSTKPLPHHINRMADVLVLRDPFEVVEPVVSSDGIFVVADQTVRRADEGFENEGVNAPHVAHALDGQRDLMVTPCSEVGLQNAPAVHLTFRGGGHGRSHQRSDAAVAGNFIVVRKFGDRAPFFDVCHAENYVEIHPTVSKRSLRFPQ